MDSDTGEKSNRLFIGFSIPTRVTHVLHDALLSFQDVIEEIVPVENWHITVLFLGECPDITESMSDILRPLRQQYLPAISLTHIGRGFVPTQLWAWAYGSPTLHHIQQDIRARLEQLHIKAPGLQEKRDFVPHIKVATLHSKTGSVLPDRIFQLTFVPKELHIYRSRDVADKGPVYTIEASIPLKA